MGRVPAGLEQGHPPLPGDQGAAADLGGHQGERGQLRGRGRLQAPALAGDTAALQLVVVEHGLTQGADRDQPEAAVGDRELLGDLGPVDRVPVLEGEPAPGGQGDTGHLACSS
jgi:hypothetical protein